MLLLTLNTHRHTVCLKHKHFTLPSPSPPSLPHGTTLSLSHLPQRATTSTISSPSATPSSEKLTTPTCNTPSATPARSQAFSIQKDGGSPNMCVNMSPNPYLKPNYGGGVGASGRVTRGSEEMGKKRERESMGELVAAVKVLGDGFVRMEQMKMEMAREMETMRMKMEMKRIEMFLVSQKRIVKAFAKALSEKKKRPKRMPSPEP